MEERIPSMHQPPLPRTPRRSPSRGSLHSTEGGATTPREEAPEVFHDPGYSIPRSESTKLKMRRRSEVSALHALGQTSSPPSRRGTSHPIIDTTSMPTAESNGADAPKPPTAASERQEVAQALRELRDHLHHDRVDMQFPRVDVTSGMMHLQRSTTQLTKEERTKLVKYAKRSQVPNVTGIDVHPLMYAESPATESPGAGGKHSNGSGAGVCAQLDWWDGRFPSHRSTALPPQSVRPARFMCGSYFSDVSENTFLAKEVVCNVAEHVDNALRLSGLIKQLGTYVSWPRSPIPVLFDEAQWMWVHATERWPMKGGALTAAKVKDRVDYVPHGIISVVGSLDVASFCSQPPKPVRSRRAAPNLAKSLAAAKGHRKRSLTASATAPKDRPVDGTAAAQKGKAPHRASIHDATVFALAATERRKQEAEAMRHTGYDVQPYDADDKDEQMIMVIGDPDSEFLSNAEVLKHIKHYLTRSVIKAARTAGASVMVSGTDDLARQLGIGYQAFLDPEGIKSAKTSVNTQLVGINARSDSDAANLSFSHNILLQCDGGHDIVLGKWGSSDCLECTRCRKTDRDNDFLIDGFCPQHPDYAAVRAKVVDEADMPSTAHVSKDEIRAYKLRMLESLHSGHYQRLVRDAETEQAPNRDAIPVLLIAFGGDETTRTELHTAALRGWPILIVEGSGGYADVLCSTINSINTLTPDASTDDYRTMLTAVDAETSAIISKGQYQIIRKGELIAQVERTILTALKGDEILHQAWKWYSSWHFNETQWLYYHQLNQLAVLLLGIYATLASVTQTFLILLYRERAVDDDFIDRWANDEVLTDEKYWYMMFRLQQWLVIGLPITLTLVHAIFQRMNPWAKLCAFRVASTSLLSEIYMYRTRTMGYSTEAVKKSRAEQGLSANDGPLGAAQTGTQLAMKAMGATTSNAQQQSSAVDPKNAQENAAIGSEPTFLYGSREELLGHRMRQIQQTLGTTEAGQVKLEVPLDTNVPPSSITKTGDGGLGDLTPDNYLKFRVTSVRQAYFRRHNQLDGQQSLLTFLVIFFGATGTALAALSAYGLGYLQAWVAFSTVVVNSLTRFLDFTRITAMSELCNTAEHRLSDVERWWSSVGTDADSDRNRTTLVSDAEHIIKCELEGWSKQMQSMDRDDERRGDRSDRAAAKADMLSKQEVAHDRKAQGTELLQNDTILRGLQDKSGAMAQKVKRQIIDLNDKLGGFVRVAQPTTQSSVPPWQAREGPLQALRDVMSERNRKREAAYVVPQAFLDKRARTAFLNLLKPDHFLDYRWLTSFSLRQSLALISPRAADAISGIHDTLHVTAIAKRIILDQFEDHFEAVLDGVPEEVRQSFTMEEFVTEMHHMHVVFGSQLRHVTKESLAQVMGHVSVREAVLLMRKGVFDQLVELCRLGFALAVVRRELKPLSWETGVGSLATLMVMLNGVGIVEANERIHVRILNNGNDEEAASHITKMIDALNQQALPLELTTKQEVLSMLPPKLLAQWSGISGFQLLQMMRMIACGTAASRCVNAAAVLLRAQCKDLREDGTGSGLIEWVNESSRREIFVAANELLTQLVINRSSKTDLIRSMQAAKAMTREFADSLSEAADEPTLKAMLSVLQAQQSNTFASHVVQRLADSFFLVDYKDLLTGDEIESLTSSVSLVPETFAVGGLSKDALLQIVPLPSLRRQLEVLDEQQLQMLIHVQRLVMAPRYFNAVWARVQQLGGIGSLARQCIMRAVHPHAAQRLIFLVTYMSRQEMLDLGLCLSTAKILQQLGDAMITQCMFGLCDDPTQETSFAMEFGRIIEDTFLLTHDDERGSGSTQGQHRTGDRLLLRLCHRMVGMQPATLSQEAGMQHYAELFFRMHRDPLTVDLNALYRLVCVRADDLLLLDDEDNHESAFGEGGHRNSGVEDMLEVFSLSPAELSDAAQLGIGLETIRADLYASLNQGDECSLVRRMRNMLVEMDIFLDLELPYMMFEEMCHCCTQFDLRDFVVNSTDRHVFAVSWFEFLSSSDGLYLPVLCDVCKVPLWNNDKDLGIAASESKAQLFKETLLRTLVAASRTQDAHDAPRSALQFANLDLLIRTVRALQEPHVVQLALVLEKLLLKSSAGRVFEWYCITRRERGLAKLTDSPEMEHVHLGGDEEVLPVASHVLSLEQVASHVLSIARGNRATIASAFFKFDAKVFAHSKTQHHEAHLRQIIPNDAIVDSLLQMREKQLRWLFIMISFTLDAEERKMREDEAMAKSLRQRFTASLKQKRNDAAGAGNVFAKILAETTALYDDDVDFM